MEYWIAMNETELQISLLLFGKTDFPGLLKVRPGFFPEETDVRKMEEKKFFEKRDEETVWNPFVKTVLWCSVNAQSELRIDQGDQAVCRLYFYNETMVLMSKDFERDLYVFYYVPLLPKAIGGLAKTLEHLENDMPSDAGDDSQITRIPAEDQAGAESIAALLEAAVPELRSGGFEPMLVNGWCLGDHTFETVLIKFRGSFCTADRDENELRLKPVGFFDFIQYMSRWIVRTHGRSIAEKENEHV